MCHERNTEPRVFGPICQTSGNTIYCARILWEVNRRKHLQGPNAQIYSVGAPFVIFFSNSTALREQVFLPVKFTIRQDEEETGRYLMKGHKVPGIQMSKS